MIYIILGLPGSGKTTASQHLEGENGLRVTFDSLFKILFPGERRGLGNEYSSHQLDVMYRSIVPVLHYLVLSKTNKPIVIDGVFRSKVQRDRLFKELVKLGVEFKLIEIKTNTKILSDRINRRHDSGSSEFDERAFEKLLLEFDDYGEDRTVVENNGSIEELKAKLDIVTLDGNAPL